jgi:hypothetical protein
MYESITTIEDAFQEITDDDDQVHSALHRQQMGPFEALERVQHAKRRAYSFAALEFFQHLLFSESTKIDLKNRFQAYGSLITMMFLL